MPVNSHVHNEESHIPDYRTIRLTTTLLRGISSAANSTNLGRGYRKELATRVRDSDGFQSLNMHLTGADDDLWDHSPVNDHKGDLLEYARDSIIEIDVWLYDRFDDLQGQVSVYGIVTGITTVHWQAQKPHMNDVLRANVLQVAGRKNK